MTPVISLSAFIIGFLLVGMIARIIAEVYIAKTTEKSPSDYGNSQTGARYTSNDAVQRFYDTYNTEKGA